MVDSTGATREQVLGHLPIIIINFKTYEEATGERAVTLAKICRSIAMKYEKRIIISPQFTDLYRISRGSSSYTPVFAQHIDDGIGKFTGSISPLAVREAGAVGTLLNHSERPLSIDEIGKRIRAAKAHGLMTLCFADSIEESLKIASLGPEMIAYEPPELVGSGHLRLHGQARPDHRLCQQGRTERAAPRRSGDKQRRGREKVAGARGGRLGGLLGVHKGQGPGEDTDRAGRGLRLRPRHQRIGRAVVFRTWPSPAPPSRGREQLETCPRAYRHNSPPTYVDTVSPRKTNASAPGARDEELAGRWPIPARTLSRCRPWRRSRARLRLPAP